MERDTEEDPALEVNSGEKKFSGRSRRDSNSKPSDHESGALTNKLSWLPRASQVTYEEVGKPGVML